MPSPESYIRTKARQLPILECLISNEWEETGIANIIISRKHTNGNITACFYLVDLYCLGIKDTHFLFNIAGKKYMEIIGRVEDYFQRVSYPLVHNIIYSGLDFADEYGLKPHKDFTSTTRFMLEEDTDDIEQIDIVCGRDGKPLLVVGHRDDPRTVKAVIVQLEKTAGAGNYEVLSEDDEDDFDENCDENEED